MSRSRFRSVGLALQMLASKTRTTSLVPGLGPVGLVDAVPILGRDCAARRNAARMPIVCTVNHAPAGRFRIGVNTPRKY